MKLCQEYGGFPEPGGLLDQDAAKMSAWIHMMNEQAKEYNTKMKRMK